MPEQQPPETGAAPVNPVQAALGVIMTVPIMVPYIAAGWALDVATHLSAGFLFALYWMVIKAMAPDEFWPTVIGFLAGLGTGFLLFTLPPVMGTAGYVIAGAVIVLALFLFNLGALKLVVNPAYLLMLTVGTTTLFHSQADYVAGSIAILLAAAYAGGAVALVGWIVKSRRRAVVAA